MIEPITIDFETEAIVGSIVTHPPKAVGYAVWVPGHDPEYLAWGHPTENNCTYDKAHQYLIKLRDSQRPLLFHNAPFDLSVWNKWFCNATFSNMKQRWDSFHDTMYLLFLNDPYAATFSLKPSAERYLGMPPDEQDAVADWIVANVPGATRKTAGAFICKAPGDLVADYAIGDVVRTRKLFDLLHPKVCSDGMQEAYDRERKLMPVLTMATKFGIKIERDKLEHHYNVYSKALVLADDALCSSLGAPGIDINGDGFADALYNSGAVSEWVLTKTGKRSMAKENLRISDPKVKVLYEYRSALETCLSTFMGPWLEFSRQDGRLHPNWNQVRQARGSNFSDVKGTRTGRLSSDNPNFQNVPTQFTYKNGEPMAVPPGFEHLPLPQMRSYCIPDEGKIWLKRDFSSQEVRILAHFEDGTLSTEYRKDVGFDPHELARRMIEQMTGTLYARGQIKITGFSIIYGSGATGLSLQLGVGRDEGFKIRNAYLAAMPDVKALVNDIQTRGRQGLPIRTWGKRQYYSEPPKLVAGVMRDFHYKLLNYLIQGSAADQTKDSVNEWSDNREWDHDFLASVHDENNIQVPIDQAESAMDVLRKSMDADRFDVPFKSDGFKGFNWADLEECK